MAVIDSADLLLQAKNYSGSGNWLDESGNGLVATPVNAPVFTSAGVASYFSFVAASTQYFTIPDNALLDFTASEGHTLMAYISNAGTKLNNQIASKRTAPGGTQGYLLGTGRIAARRANFFNGDDAAPIVEVTDAAAHDTGVHVLAGKFDPSPNMIELFVDGVSVGTVDASGVTNTRANTSAFLIGRWDTSYFEGRIHAVVLWRSALSDADIATAGTELTVAGSGNLLLLGVG